MADFPYLPAPQPAYSWGRFIREQDNPGVEQVLLVLSPDRLARRARDGCCMRSQAPNIRLCLQDMDKQYGLAEQFHLFHHGSSQPLI